MGCIIYIYIAHIFHIKSATTFAIPLTCWIWDDSPCSWHQSHRATVHVKVSSQPIFSMPIRLPSGYVKHSYWKSPFIVDFPINSMVIFHSYVSHYQRVYGCCGNNVTYKGITPRFCHRNSYANSVAVRPQLWINGYTATMTANCEQLHHLDTAPTLCCYTFWTNILFIHDLVHLIHYSLWYIIVQLQKPIPPDYPRHWIIHSRDAH